MLDISVKKKPRSTTGVCPDNLIVNPIVKKNNGINKYMNKSLLLNFFKIMTKTSVSTAKTKNSVVS